ncbi:MAG: glycosyltransferase family 39 protein [Nitrososphaerota archaeon]
MIIIGFLIASIIFLPGVLLLSALSQKIRINLNFLEKLLYGSILWNYFLVAPSTLLGLFIRSIISYFNIFTVISIVAMIISVAYLTKSQKTSLTINLKIKLRYLLYTPVFLALITFSFITIYFHTFYIEWDAIAYYIPAAKAILTGGLIFNSYRSLNFIEHSPAIPIIYAWILNYTNLESLYNLALIYFLLTLATIYLIAKKLFPEESALTSLLIFTSLPTVIVVIGSRSLYLDIPFLLYFLFTLYCLTKIVNAQKIMHNFLCFEYGMLGIGFTLMILTRIEFGAFLAPAVFATFVALLKLKSWKIISILALGLTHYLREIRNVLLNPSQLSYYTERLIPIFIILGVILIIIRNISSMNNPNIKNKALNKKFFIFILIIFSTTLPLILYILRNVIILGFVVPIIPILNNDILRSAMFFNEINPPKIISLAEMLRWDYLILVWWLAPPYFTPMLISLASMSLDLIKRKNTRCTVIPVLIFFVSIFILWSVTLHCDPQPRRLYYFAPFIALVITHGLLKLKKFFDHLGFALRILTYVTIITTYTLTKMNIKAINDIPLIYARLYEPSTDIEFTIISALIFLMIFTPYEFLINKIKKSVPLSPKILAIIVILVIGLNIILILNSISPILVDLVNNENKSRYKYYGGWLHYPEAANYYNEKITDYFVTICFYCHELITFANRSIIDLSNPIYGMPIYSIITTANETEMLSKIRELNIKYFLEPKQDNPFFSLYKKLVNTTVLGKILVNKPQIRYLADFKYVTLYTLEENYKIVYIIPDRIMPWNYNPETNYTLIIKQNVTEFTAITNNNGRISLMYIFTQPLTINEALSIVIRSYNQSKLVVIMFTNLQNRTTDYFIYQHQLIGPMVELIINLKQGIIVGNFNPNHIEGIMIGIETQPNTTQTIEIYELKAITYET